MSLPADKLGSRCHAWAALFFVLVALLSRPGHCLFFFFFFSNFFSRRSCPFLAWRQAWSDTLFSIWEKPGSGELRSSLGGVVAFHHKDGSGLLRLLWFSRICWRQRGRRMVGGGYRRQQAGKYIFGGCASVFACIVIPGPLTFGVLWCQGDHWMEETAELRRVIG